MGGVLGVVVLGCLYSSCKGSGSSSGGGGGSSFKLFAKPPNTEAEEEEEEGEKKTETSDQKAKPPDYSPAAKPPEYSPDVIKWTWRANFPRYYWIGNDTGQGLVYASRGVCWGYNGWENQRPMNIR